MLLESFDKQTKPEYKEKYKLYGDKLIETLISDIRFCNKIYYKTDKATPKNLIQIESLLKQTVGYITSYYIRASIEDENDRNIMISGLCKDYSKRVKSMLEMKELKYKNYRELVQNFLCLAMCRACLDNNDYIEAYDYDMKIHTEDLTLKIVHKVGYAYFLNELYVQCYILSIFRSFILRFTMFNNGRTDIDYNDYLYSTILHHTSGNYDFPLSKSRLFRKLKEFEHMKFESTENYGKICDNILKKDNNMCECMENVRNFMENMNKARIDNKKLIDMTDIRVLGGI